MSKQIEDQLREVNRSLNKQYDLMLALVKVLNNMVSEYRHNNEKVRELLEDKKRTFLYNKELGLKTEDADGKRGDIGISGQKA